MSFKDVVRTNERSKSGEYWYDVLDPEFRDGVCAVLARYPAEAVIYAYTWYNRDPRNVAGALILFWMKTKGARSIELAMRYDMDNWRVRLYKEEIERYLTLL